MPPFKNDLDRLTLQIDRLALQVEKLTTRIGDLVGIYDNLNAKLDTLRQTIVDELTQIRDAITEARNSGGDPAGLEAVEGRVDELITSVGNLAEEAAAEVPPDEPPVE